MLNLCKIAEWSRNRARVRTSDLKPVENKTRAFAAAHQAFHKRLLDACRLVSDSPKSVSDRLFIALPERLLGKCAYLCLGKSRKTSEDAKTSRPKDITDEMIECLKAYDEEGQKAQFVNLEFPEQTQHIKHVLLCHGLSPIEDSILLLADLGRAYRASRALALETQVMLADVSWMSSNRSVRQFPTITDVDTGLRVCLHKRTRLYDAVNISPKLHEIVPFDKANKISGKKLEQISSRYLELARVLWGEKAVGRLEHDRVKAINQLLDRISLRSNEDVPRHINTLGQFPGVLGAIEEKLKPHLEILRVIAKQFNSFDEEVFTYFFAQYYAQDAYRGSVMKVAPESEKTFDEPFDKLDPYFRAWGEGHSTTDILLGSSTTSKTLKPLSVTYLPQYSIGGLTVLPYTPLSLDALRLEVKDHKLVKERLVMLEDLPENEITAAVEKNQTLLEKTAIVKRNRLVGDVASFLMLCMSQQHKQEIDRGCRSLGYASFDDLLGRFSPILPSIFAREMEAQTTKDIHDLWVTTWLENIPVDEQPDYIPFHLYFYLLDVSDWSVDVLSAGGSLLALAQLMYMFFTA